VSESEQTPPPLTESARSVFDAAHNIAGAWGGTFTALRRLLVADLALAKTALVHGLVLLLVAAILFGTAWVLLTAFAVWALHKAGIGWGFSIGVPFILSVTLGALFFWRAAKALRLADLDASRRQLTLWFGTSDEVEEAKQAPPGSLHAGAPPMDKHAEPNP
jgi:uncharacterized membrane protein YqjE